jgi:hypothetical protein
MCSELLSVFGYCRRLEGSAPPLSLAKARPMSCQIALSRGGVDYGGQGFGSPWVATRWLRTESSVHRARRRMKPGSQVEYGL